jgi:hypothetical protein
MPSVRKAHCSLYLRLHVEWTCLLGQEVARKLAECYCDEDANEGLSYHPHPTTGIRMSSLKLMEREMTENK